MLTKTKSCHVCWKYQFIFFKHKLDDLFSETNRELNEISLWLKANKLSLNLTKAKYSLFHAASKKIFLREPLPSWKWIILPLNLGILLKQPPRGVLKKSCSENKQQIYRRTPMPKCDFNKVTLQIYWNHTSAWVFSCNFAAYFQNTFY